MKRLFSPGQKVIALKTHTSEAGTLNIIKGHQYTIGNLSCCPKCGWPTVSVTEVNYNTRMEHQDCGHVYNSELVFLEGWFAPLSTTSDAIEYKLTVSIPELTEIKRIKEQEVLS